MDLLVTKTKRQPLKVLGLLALIAAAAILMGIIVPGAIALKYKVFYQKDIQSIVDKKLADVKASMDECKNKQSELGQAPPPISVQPFYGHLLMYFWPLMYFCLGTLVVLLRPICDHRSSSVLKRALEIIIIGSILCAFDLGLLFFRTEFLSDPSAGRTVYAYSNPDVSFESFSVQLMHFVIFCYLLATLWHQWSSYYAERIREIESNRCETGLEATFDAHNLDRVSKELLHWQICLGVLSSAFIIYTAIFWKQIIQNGDRRFLIEAFFVHALWLISAVIMAMPFWVTWRAWRFDRIRAIGELVHRPDFKADDLNSKLSALRELRPVGSWNVTTVIATVFSSIVAPLAELIFKFWPRL